MFAATVNAIAYGLYTVVLVYTNADFPLWEKVLVTAFCNLIGVYVVKAIEEKTRKDKLWKIETTIKEDRLTDMIDLLDSANISFSSVDTNTEYVIFNIYCETQKESLAVKEILQKFNAKYFVSETKIL